MDWIVAVIGGAIVVATLCGYALMMHVLAINPARWISERSYRPHEDGRAGARARPLRRTVP